MRSAYLSCPEQQITIPLLRYISLLKKAFLLHLIQVWDYWQSWQRYHWLIHWSLAFKWRHMMERFYMQTIPNSKCCMKAVDLVFLRWLCLYNIMYLLLCFGRYIYIPTIQIITQLGVFGQVSGCSQRCTLGSTQSLHPFTVNIYKRIIRNNF